MKLTYIGHSGFLVEWPSCYWLFDYYIGEIPAMDRQKNVLVFSSHAHADHFNPDIFELSDAHPRVRYILSSDIPKDRVPDSLKASVTFVEPHQEYVLCDAEGEHIALTTLKSTDEGVAFLLRYKAKTVYHAGDLNLWVWKEETRRYNEQMTADFDAEMGTLRGVCIDVAFVPLDPRQEEHYYLGLERLLQIATVKHVFPMHFGVENTIIERFKRERTYSDTTRIMDIDHPGQTWEIQI